MPYFGVSLRERGVGESLCSILLGADSILGAVEPALPLRRFFVLLRQQLRQFLHRRLRSLQTQFVRRRQPLLILAGREKKERGSRIIVDQSFYAHLSSCLVFLSYLRCWFFLLVTPTELSSHFPLS